MIAAPPSDNALDATAEALMLSVGQLVRRLRAESNPGELTWSQAATLGRLERDGPTSIADLARAESVRPQSMGTSVACLEEEGWVERRPHPTDGRQVLFALTQRGRAARSERRLAKREWLLAAMAELSPSDQEALAAAVTILDRLGRA